MYILLYIILLLYIFRGLNSSALSEFWIVRERKEFLKLLTGIQYMYINTLHFFKVQFSFDENSYCEFAKCQVCFTCYIEFNFIIETIVKTINKKRNKSIVKTDSSEWKKKLFLFLLIFSNVTESSFWHCILFVCFFMFIKILFLSLKVMSYNMCIWTKQKTKN